MALAGHVFRDTSSPAHQQNTWIPTHRRTARGRLPTTYIDVLLRDSGLENVKKTGKLYEEP